MTASVPLLPTATRSFDRIFSDNLHSRIHPLPRISKGKLRKETIPSWNGNQQVCQVGHHTTAKSSEEVLSITHKVASSDCNQISQVEASKKIVKGTVEKEKILREYEAKFGNGASTSIVTRKKGETPSITHSSISSCTPPTKKMKPCSKKYYRVDDLSFHNVVAIVLRESRSHFSQADRFNLALLDKNFHEFVPLVLRWLDVDFSSLQQLRLDYQSQQSICQHRVEMMNAAMVAFGLDPGKLVRYLGGEYTGESRDTERILKTIGPYISETDANHIRRILQSGCPAELQLTESSSSKLEMMHRGNQKSFNENQDIVKEKMNKEERYSHIIPLHRLMCLFSPYLRHTPQGIVIKVGKDPRLVWDGSTKRRPDDIVLNEVTPTDDKPEITFGDAKNLFYNDLYNTRISYPDDDILLATSDIKACFRHPRVHPDLTGAFGFYADDYYWLASAMVFGHLVSCPSWEPFRRAIEKMSVVFADRTDLVEKHRAYLNMISWDTEKPSAVKLTRAFACKLNKGVLDMNGRQICLPARIYVDDALLAAVGRKQMEQRLAAIIEAIFTVLGEPEVKYRQCPLAMDKWSELKVSHEQIILGLILTCTGYRRF